MGFRSVRGGRTGSPSDSNLAFRSVFMTYDFTPMFRTSIGFDRRFVLSGHIVVGGAELKNGLLHVGLKRVVPEALKPRTVAISTSSIPAIASATQASAGLKAA